MVTVYGHPSGVQFFGTVDPVFAQKQIHLQQMLNNYRSGNWGQLKLELNQIKASYFQNVSADHISEYADILFLEAFASLILNDGQLGSIRNQMQVFFGSIHTQDVNLSKKLNSMWLLINYWTPFQEILSSDLPNQNKLEFLKGTFAQFLQNCSTQAIDEGLVPYFQLLSAAFKVLIPDENRNDAMQMIMSAYVSFEQNQLIGHKKYCVAQMAILKLIDLQDGLIKKQYANQLDGIDREFTNFYPESSLDQKDELDRCFVRYLSAQFRLKLLKSKNTFLFAQQQFSELSRQYFPQHPLAEKYYVYVTALVQYKIQSMTLFFNTQE